MFCYQRSFSRPTEAVTEEVFWALVRAPYTAELIEGFRSTGDAALKRRLPAFIFQATFDESVSRSGLKGRWRKQAASRLTGLCVMDIDHVEPEELSVKSEEYGSEAFRAKAAELGILLIYVTPSGRGLKVVFKADAARGNLIDNQHAMGRVLGVAVDESGKDASRMSFICREKDILFINTKELFTYENPAFSEKYNADYRAGRSAAAQAPAVADQPAQQGAEGRGAVDAESPVSYNGVPCARIIEAWMEGVSLEGNRHNTLVDLASHLRYVIGKNPVRIEAAVMQLPWVQQLASEGENVASTVRSVMDFKYHEHMPRKLREALERAGALSPANCQLSIVNSPDDVYASLPLDRWAEELQEMTPEFPCMKELFLNVHPHKMPAVLFSGAALLGTLMTRTWYRFWFEPEILRRLNYCIFIIGDPGAGKNVIEKFYKRIADPMVQADSCLIEAVNRYKEGRTERSTSTKAQKGEALKRPMVGIRVHPARTATGEFIRHMNAAVETVDGRPLNLHMFSFDAELDNVTKQNKGGDWKDREVLELKAFHNEEDGQMYANQESVTGMFNVYWNFIYTGTPYALHRKVNQRNFGTGMSTRLAVIPLPDKGRAERHQPVDPDAGETLRTWAYRLDRVEGEIPLEALNDETFEWQSSRLEIAEFNGDKADRTLLKRIPYYGIGVSLPFILMRHWDEWQESRTLTMDDLDRRLCRLAMDIQYRCQHFFFGEMAHNYFENQSKEFVQRRRSSRYDDCFRKLPEEFRTQQFMEVFGCSQQAASRAIVRFQEDGVVETVKYGLYRKLASELP